MSRRLRLPPHSQHTSGNCGVRLFPCPSHCRISFCPSQLCPRQSPPHAAAVPCHTDICPQSHSVDRPRSCAPIQAVPGGSRRDLVPPHKPTHSRTSAPQTRDRCSPPSAASQCARDLRPVRSPTGNSAHRTESHSIPATSRQHCHKAHLYRTLTRSTETPTAAPTPSASPYRRLRP